MITAPGPRSRDITEHVGKLLHIGRVADGVPVEKLVDGFLAGNLAEVQAIEDDPRPINMKIENYTLICRVEYVRSAARQRRTYAARQQYWAGPLDNVLTTYARLKNPALQWWWADRKDGPRHGPLCYLCDRYMSATQITIGIDDRWRWPIMEHRHEHLTAYGAGMPVVDIKGITYE